MNRGRERERRGEEKSKNRKGSEKIRGGIHTSFI